MSEEHPKPSFPFEGPYPETNDLEVDALRNECERWRSLWSWTPAIVKYALDQVGKDCRVVLRTNQGYLGTLLMGEFEQKSIEIRVFHREYNAQANKSFIEDKTLFVPISGIGHFEIIHDTQPEDKDNEELDGPISDLTYEDVVPT